MLPYRQASFCAPAVRIPLSLLSLRQMHGLTHPLQPPAPYNPFVICPPGRARSGPLVSSYLSEYPLPDQVLSPRFRLFSLQTFMFRISGAPVQSALRQHPVYKEGLSAGYSVWYAGLCGTAQAVRRLLLPSARKPSLRHS